MLLLDVLMLLLQVLLRLLQALGLLACVLELLVQSAKGDLVACLKRLQQRVCALRGEKTVQNRKTKQTNEHQGNLHVLGMLVCLLFHVRIVHLIDLCLR